MSGEKERKKLVGLSDDAEEKWVKYYSSHHQILLVGEGDFSFSLCLAQSFGSAFNIVASSLDTHDEVVRKYKKAMLNLVALTKLGAYVLHGVDATQMKFHPYLEMRRFDRIIFNFPHAGFHGREDSFSMIQKHKNLIRGFFMNARSMLRSNGEIHVNHKITPPFDDWCIKELGIQSLLWPIECVEFKKEDYLGYNNKRGDGSRCDKPFRLGKCCTFKFTLLTKKELNPRNQRILINHHYPLTSLSPHSPTSVISCRNGHLPIFGEGGGGGGYLNSEIEIMGRAGSGSGYVEGTSSDLQRPLWPESTVFRQVSGFVHGISSDLQRPSWPKSTEFRYPQTEHVGNMDMIRGRSVSEYGVSSDLQRSSWPRSTELRFPQTEHVRNMDMIGGRSVSEYVHGISCDLQRRSWLEFNNDMYIRSDKVRDENDTLRPYHASWF